LGFRPRPRRSTELKTYLDRYPAAPSRPRRKRDRSNRSKRLKAEASAREEPKNAREDSA
jgi:hypothetical protein